MQTIEFEAQLKDGKIELPEHYRHWRENGSVKVIVLASDDQPQLQKVDSPSPPGRGARGEGCVVNINRHAGKVTLTQDPLDYQNAMRDEWT